MKELKDYIMLTSMMFRVKPYRLDGIDFEAEYELIKKKESKLPSAVRDVILVAVSTYNKEKEE